MILNSIFNQPRIVVTFSGRFQPFHKGHYAVYDQLISEFGESRVWICSSNKQEVSKSPFSFEEKQLIATRMFGIPKSRFRYTKEPYKPKELLVAFDPYKDIHITVLSDKDSSRFPVNSRYFKYFNVEEDLQPFSEHGYIYIVSNKANNINATFMRNSFIQNQDINSRKTFFKNCYGRFDKLVFDLFEAKLK